MNILANLAIFIGIVILINLISINLFFRLDFSKGKVYSLSTSSKSAVRRLEDKMIVKAYFTEQLPPQYASLRRYTRDLLEEYKNASYGGRFRYEFINPTDENQLKQEAQKNGVAPAQVQVREKDRVEVREAYMGLVLAYEGKTVTIPLVKETKGLEYEITKAINKIASFEMPTVGFYGLAPEIPDNPILRMFMQQQDKYQLTKTTIREHYDMVEVTLDSPIQPNVTTLVFSGTVDTLTTQQLYYIDQYLMKGNTAIFFQPTTTVNIQNQQVQKINSNIFDLLAHYGINIQDNIIMDNSCATVNMQEQRGWSVNVVPVRYPFIIIANNVNTANPIAAKLSNLQYYFPSEIDTLSIPEGVQFTPLVYTSNQTNTTRGPYYNIAIQQFLDRNFVNNLNQKRKVLSALYEGRFTSYFAVNPGFEPSYQLETENAKIIVVPDMEFPTSQIIQQNEANRNFLMNAIDALIGNPALVELRSREVINKPLHFKAIEESDLPQDIKEKKLTARRNTIKGINYALPAVLLVLFGVGMYYYENLRRKGIKETYE